jgi:hypothetical protein
LISGGVHQGVDLSEVVVRRAEDLIAAAADTSRIAAQR